MKAAEGLLRGAAWTAGMKIVVAGISFGFFAVVARHWGIERLGELSLVYTCYVISQQLPLLGLHYPMLRDVAQQPARASTLIRAVSAIGFTSALAMCAVLSFVMPAIYGVSLRIPFLLVGVALIPGVIVAIAETLLVAREQLARVARISMTENFARTVVWLGVVYAGGGIVLLFSLLLLGRIVVAMVYLTRVADVNQTLRVMHTTRRDVGAQLRSAPPFFSILVLTACINRLDFLMLSRMSGTATLGLYSTPYRIYEGLLMVPQALSVALSPRIARDFAPYSLRDSSALGLEAESAPTSAQTPRVNTPLPEHQVLVRMLCRLAVLFGAPLSLFLAVIAEPLITFIFGPAYSSSAPVLVWLAGVPVLAAIDQCLGLVLLATRRQRADLGVLCASSVFYAASLYVLVSRYGATGAAAATCLTAVVQLVVRYATVRAAVRIQGLVAELARPSGAILVAIAAMVVLSASSLFVKIPVLLTSYAICVFAFRAVTISEIRGCIRWLQSTRRRTLSPAPAA